MPPEDCLASKARWRQHFFLKYQLMKYQDILPAGLLSSNNEATNAAPHPPWEKPTTASIPPTSLMACAVVSNPSSKPKYFPVLSSLLHHAKASISSSFPTAPSLGIYPGI